MERLGEYLVTRLVGEGGMGRVYEACERLSRRRVALKVLRPELGGSASARQMFVNEMTILAQLDHPNIVRSLACSEIDGELVMTLELLEGETLRQRLVRRGRLPWVEAVAIVADIAAALAAAHGHAPPIAHRDLKPENLMIVAGERVKVMDFGIGKMMQAIGVGARSSQGVGTLAYMSPEQLDAGAIDQRTDFYSLGLVLYEMLAGAPPFQTESPREQLERQCTAPPPPLPAEVRAELPRGVERLLARLLEKAPANRPASAQEITAALEPFVAAGERAEAASAPAPRTNESLGPVSAVSGPALRAPTVVAAGSGLGARATVGPGAPALPRLDTVTRAASASAARRARRAPTMTPPRPQISTRRALAILVAVCALAGVASYLVRRQSIAPHAAPPLRDAHTSHHLPEAP